MRQVWVALLLVSMALAGCADDSAPARDGEEDKFDDIDLDASKTTGVIRGVVVDPSITPIAEAKIVLVNSGQETMSNANGAFGFSDLQPGTYFLKVSKVGFDSVQQSVDVVAGVSKPPIAKILLPPNPESVPFAVPYAYTGFMSCGFKAANYVFDSYWCDPTGNLGYQARDDSEQTFNFTSELTPWHFQSEMVWDANQPLSNGLVNIICALQDASCGSGVGSDRICNVRGPSPLICKVNRADPSNTVPGGGNNFTTVRDGAGVGSHFSVGTFSNCAFQCVIGAVGLGFALDQRYDLYVHVFYNFEPEEDWEFIEDGAPVPPGN